jgi:hypothetical protein
MRQLHFRSSANNPGLDRFRQMPLRPEDKAEASHVFNNIQSLVTKLGSCLLMPLS